MVTSNRTGIFNIYTIPVAGGPFKPLTSSDSSSIYGISYFPGDERILFRMDDNGDEIYKLYVKNGDSIQRLTPAENVRALFYTWAKDDSSFYYASNQRDNRFMDLYKMDIETFTPKLVFENTDGYEVSAISSEGNYLALSKALNTNDSDLYLYSLKDQDRTKINQEQSANNGQDFSKDGRYLYYTSDLGAEFSYLMKYDIVKRPRKSIRKRMGYYGDGTFRAWQISGYL